MDLSFMAAQVKPLLLPPPHPPHPSPCVQLFAPIMPLSWAWLLHKFILGPLLTLGGDVVGDGSSN